MQADDYPTVLKWCVPFSAEVAEVMKQMLAQLSVVSSQLTMVVTGAIANSYLPSSSLGTAAKQRLRQQVLTEYKATDDKGWVWCVATHQYWPAVAETTKNVPYVRACHIFQRRWPVYGWVGWGHG